ncbi:MAG: enoyl-CoA hydratase/isomerase family protein [Pseudomonadales bacterium]|nr:enoyl-CoA hydratase/isomerase family protein [Pseudomonadales bacterium]MDG2079681.1 enoyl-CoA hydratase/isomerase family protein [Pseudomonadales bacterium]
MINLCKDGDVYILTMNNNANTICLDWQEQMLEALHEMENNCGKGTALIMTGEGKFFSNGINIDVMSKFDEPDMKKFAQRMLEIHRRMLILPFPTVAAINGHAFAGGAFLALSLDYRLMREDRGWVCISEVDAGVPIPAPMMDILHAKLPPATARDAVLTGKRYTADEAIVAGLIDGKATSEALLDKAAELATTLANKEPDIFKTIKQALYRNLAARMV